MASPILWIAGVHKCHLGWLVVTVLSFCAVYSYWTDPLVDSDTRQIALVSDNPYLVVDYEVGKTQELFERIGDGRSEEVRHKEVLELGSNKTEAKLSLNRSIALQRMIDREQARSGAKRNFLREGKTGPKNDIIDYKYKATTLSTPAVTKPVTSPPNCQAMLDGDKQEIAHAKRYKLHEKYSSPPDSHFGVIAQDCEKFRERGYHKFAMSEEESQFPIAFALRMYNKVAQAEQLLRTIYMPQNVYCIYVDKKAKPDVHHSMSAIANCFPNVYLASHTENFYYSSFSPVAADMQCMKDLLNTSVNWKYFINMAGTEFPLRTNLEMVRILKVLNGTNDIEQYPYPKQFFFRINETFTVHNDYTYSTGRPKVPFSPQLDLQKGCSYNLFSRAFIKWILTDKLAQDFIEWSRDTMAPDEVVWATLNHLPQAPGGYTDMVTQVAKTLLAREVIWQWSNAYCWGQYFVHGICILSTPDLNWLSRRWEFFANKFDLNYDHIVVDCLAERHHNRTMNPDPDNNVNWGVIMRTPQVKAALARGAGSLTDRS